ncbi:MAG: polysaccharide pyruvyl transferase family protein [Bacillota bacterium]
MKKVLIRGYYDFNNFGDDALLYTLIKKIFGDHHEYMITILGNKKIFNDENVSYSSTKKLNILKQILRNDLLVFGGGSQFQDFGIKRSMKGFIFKLLMILVAKCSGTKVIHLGISIGPIETKIGKLLTKLSLIFSDLIIVRDKKSLLFLNQEIKNKSHYCQLPDLTLLLYNDQRAFKMGGNINIGFNILPFSQTTSSGKDLQNELFNNFRKALTLFKGKYQNVSFTFFAFQNDPKVSDLVEINNITDENSVIVAYEGSIDEFNTKLAQCTHFVSMRFHAAVFAYMNNLPQINLAYHQKCREFMNEAKYDDAAYLDIINTAITAKDILNMLERLLESPEDFMPKSNPSQMYEELNTELKKLI